MSNLKLAVVKNNLCHDEDLPDDFHVGAYAAAGKYLDEYEDTRGRIYRKEGYYAGAGVGHERRRGVEAKLPNAGAAYEEIDDGLRGVAQAEVCSLSVSHGKYRSGVGALKAGAGFQATEDVLIAVAQAEAIRSSMSYGPLGVEAGLLKAGAGVRAGEGKLAAKVEAKLAEVSGKAGPVKATLGVSADTGVEIGEDGLDVKFLGTGFKFGREIGFSVGGSGFSFKMPW